MVYQHDTPDQNLLEKTARAYSHGCMRLQNPYQYAEMLLSISQPVWYLRARHQLQEPDPSIHLAGEAPTLTHHLTDSDFGDEMPIRAHIHGTLTV
jgi:hypothetical protein